MYDASSQSPAFDRYDGHDLTFRDSSRESSRVQPDRIERCGTVSGGGVSIDYEALWPNVGADEIRRMQEERDRKASESMLEIKQEVTQRLEGFQADVARRNTAIAEEYIVHQPNSGSFRCSAADLESMAARGLVAPTDFVRNTQTGSTDLAIDVTWIRKILVSRKHEVSGQSPTKLITWRRWSIAAASWAAGLAFFAGVGVGWSMVGGGAAQAQSPLDATATVQQSAQR